MAQLGSTTVSGSLNVSNDINTNTVTATTVNATTINAGTVVVGGYTLSIS
jgi:hypothetical protein